MAIDFMQFLVATFEVEVVTRRLQLLAKQANISGSPDNEHPTFVDIALRILGENPRVRQFVENSHVREQGSHFAPSSKLKILAKARRLISVQQVHPMSIESGTTRDTRAATDPTLADIECELRSGKLPDLIQLKTLQIEYVNVFLKLLYMIEFYVLIEFVEVVVAAMYSMYLATLLYLPNRAYYPQFATRTDAELGANAARLATYTAAEMVSLMVICLAMNRKIRPLTTTQQLGFVLQKHWRIVHATYLMWAFVVLQIRFEHFGAFHWRSVVLGQHLAELMKRSPLMWIGTDYSFKFDWMRVKPTGH